MSAIKRPVGVPEQLPARLTITLWDFSWYAQTAAGQPFEDLDRAFDQARERGYNTVRICAMPLLLFGGLGIDTCALHFTGMGGGVGAGTRWYDIVGDAVLDGRAHLLALFQAAARHDMYVIVSSWEYQQSPAFLAEPTWYEALMAIEPGQRHRALAAAYVAMVEFLTEHELADRIAYIEVHNEVDLSRLAEVGGPGADGYWSQRSANAAAIAAMRERLPDQLITTCYGITPYLDMGCWPEESQVAHSHVYVYGVLGALERWAGVRAQPPEFPSANLRGLLRANAPAFETMADVVPAWRTAATGVSPSMFYTYDNVDPDSWDCWLYEHYGQYAEAMRWAIEDRLRAVAIWAGHHRVPAVIGEGWVGYTPLFADFEDGPIGQAIADFAVGKAIELGYWGIVLGSNCAPHHPGWANLAWQRALNDRFLSGGNSHLGPR